ncbi:MULTISPECIES: glycine betaine ABC transporter substrate-binding protein [Cyanophyceae]|uniref:glycine betaine ABC transporter substrate-binding protein n=1 Tax=Cyanophyceae TaxID=3028117 RepID=UPI0016839D6D|nr:MULTISPECIES: glycine betaine ABC transporter substrate-binding protein [Cyanophyceae]MBD1916570.1 quaternary ammonium transporter [Phormidium sp. FACHB-77]MBD2032137.1 quaternary ammonium transporter [Phormidium sp. FACHB-322]MBD2053017.1 quaternary ammonium transporter [Leptolyngbya sp. FACHB-60]
MTLTRRWFSQACLGVATALVTAACGGGGGGGDVVSVGSKDFTEQLIIGEMYALVLEENSLTVERKLNLGGTPVAQAAIESGEIDLYPEYTGTALLTVLKQPVSSDQQAVFDTVKQAYQEQFNLVWLDPSPMNNTQALAMTEEQADALGIRTISDFAAQASNLTLIGPPEFEVREDGLPGLQAAYGNFSVKEYKAVDAGLRYKGLVDGEADVAVAFGTDGEISAFNLVVLEDDEGLFPPYQVAPIVSQAALDANPAIAEALNQVSPLLNDEVMRQLNYEVSGNQREPADVAREFLVDAGLVAE